MSGNGQKKWLEFKPENVGQIDALLGTPDNTVWSRKDAEVNGVLVECMARGVTLKANRGFLEQMRATPKDSVTPDMRDWLKRHKVRIVRAIQDKHLMDHDEIACERHVMLAAKQARARGVINTMSPDAVKEMLEEESRAVTFGHRIERDPFERGDRHSGLIYEDDPND